MRLKFKPFNPDTIVVHCSATPPDRDVDAAEINRWHRAKGWRMIGYHYVIKRDGTIETGRPITEAGAHVRGHNSYTIGICLVGGVDSNDIPEENFTADQQHSLYRLVATLVDDFKITMCIGHRDIPGVNKACPSFDVMDWLDGTILAKQIFENA